MPKKSSKKTVKKATVKKTAKKAVKKSSKSVKKSARTALAKIKKNDPEREERIDMEIVVDAYDSGERAVGWYCFLEDTLSDEVRCQCFKERSMSPLEIGDEVDVLDMAPQDDCMSEMFVYVDWNGRKIAVPLNQLEPLDGDEEAVQAIEDWLYWCLMGYEF